MTNYLKERNIEVVPVSAATNKGLKELMLKVNEKLQTIEDTVLIDGSEEEFVYKTKVDDLVKKYGDKRRNFSWEL